MTFVLFEMLDFLLTVEHLPAFDAKDFSIRFLFNRIEPSNEAIPLRGVSFDHNFIN